MGLPASYRKKRLPVELVDFEYFKKILPLAVKKEEYN